MAKVQMGFRAGSHSCAISGFLQQRNELFKLYEERAMDTKVGAIWVASEVGEWRGRLMAQGIRHCQVSLSRWVAQLSAHKSCSR